MYDIHKSTNLSTARITKMLRCNSIYIQKTYTCIHMGRKHTCIYMYVCAVHTGRNPPKAFPADKRPDNICSVNPPSWAHSRYVPTVALCASDGSKFSTIFFKIAGRKKKNTTRRQPVPFHIVFSFMYTCINICSEEKEWERDSVDELFRVGGGCLEIFTAIVEFKPQTFAYPKRFQEICSDLVSKCVCAYVVLFCYIYIIYVYTRMRLLFPAWIKATPFINIISLQLVLHMISRNSSHQLSIHIFIVYNKHLVFFFFFLFFFFHSEYHYKYILLS